MKIRNKVLSCLAALQLAVTATPMPSQAATERVRVGWRGDLNGDDTITIADVVILQKHVALQETLSPEIASKADMNENATIDAVDLTLLKRCVMQQMEWVGIYEEVEIPDENAEFLTPPIAQVGSSLPSSTLGNLVIFYVDFPDCSFNNKLTAEQVDQVAFGAADADSSYYPFESMSAFYERSSKGSFQLSGKTFAYTAQNSISVYNDDKVRIVEECYDAFKDSEDFTQYDANNDGKIDATLICVPESASFDYWWPCSGGFGDPSYRVDGMAVGNIITGYATPSDPVNFNSTYIHEMGHCMGLPDYYLYYSDSDSEGMHGSAGTEMMDTDAQSDFCAFSKLMLGWYRKDQVQVYDASKGTQTFTLHNAQTDEGNCLIIPYGTLDENYFSEYMILEYGTDGGNNKMIQSLWWQTIDSGICAFHVNAELFSDYGGSYLKYQNGSYYTDYDDEGIRLIRLVNDGGGVFKSGSVIDNSTSGFGWYDSNGNESIDPGVTITIGDVTGDSYTVTVSPK